MLFIVSIKILAWIIIIASIFGSLKKAVQGTILYNYTERSGGTGWYEKITDLLQFYY